MHPNITPTNDSLSAETTQEIIFHEDQGHGWLEVDRNLLETLQIAETISAFSHQRGTKVYLEQDSDAARFCDAAKTAGWKIDFTTIPRVNYPYSAPIRAFDSYTRR